MLSFWVSVNDYLPPRFVDVLVVSLHDDEIDVLCGRLVNKTGKIFESYTGDILPCVTHWMNMPDPPNE